MNFFVFPSPPYNWTEQELKNEIIYIPFYDRSQEKNVSELQSNQNPEKHEINVLRKENNEVNVKIEDGINQSGKTNLSSLQKSQSKYLSNDVENNLPNFNNVINSENGSMMQKNNLENNNHIELGQKDVPISVSQVINNNLEKNKDLNSNQNQLNPKKSTEAGSKIYSDLPQPILYSEKLLYHIPCLYLPAKDHRAKFVLFFHGNGEDIYASRELCLHICENLMCHVIAMEYPGYSCFKGTPSENVILQNAMVVYEYMIKDLNIDSQDILIIGRSIGTGPSCWLASKRDVGAQILVSAFTSIKDVVQSMAGYLISLVVKDRFDNKTHIKNVKCPIFFLHGMKDNVVPFEHSEIQYESVTVPSELYLPKEMTHGSFNFDSQFTDPVNNFLRKIHYNQETDKTFWMKFKLFKKPE